MEVPRIMAILRNVIAPLVFSVGVIATLGGCKFFDLTNPFMPTARLFAVPASQSMDTVDYTFAQTTGTITTTVNESDVQVKSYPGDGMPGVLINSYSAEYLDEAGKS